MTSTAIIVELFLTFELPQPRVAGLRGPGEREEKVGQSESIGPSAHYCPPASTEPPTDIFFSLKPTGINHFFCLSEFGERQPRLATFLFAAHSRYSEVSTL